jgi:RluA family pseudouridine synthase
MPKWEVSLAEAGHKLIDFIKLKLGSAYSNRQLKRWIDSNRCQIDGRVERFASTRVSAGNQIYIEIEELSPKPKIDRQRILYEDEALLIYNKPAGISSDDPQFIKALCQLAPALQLVHRLDKDTTGVLIFAKSETVYQQMIQLFRQKQIHKTYYALVDGVPEKRSGVIDNYLGKIQHYVGQTRWGSVEPKKGMHARTEWRLEKVGKQATLLVCHPITGRTHQIRVHLSESGHPILGDYQYGRLFRSPLRPHRCLLHAKEVSFTHPLTGRQVTVEAPLPEDFQDALQKVIL